MHRGSSKGGRSRGRPPGSLPLSASPSRVRVSVEIARAESVRHRTVTIAPGARLRDVVHQVGQSPEGCAVLVDGISVPLDLPVQRAMRLVIVPTFSGG